MYSSIVSEARKNGLSLAVLIVSGAGSVISLLVLVLTRPLSDGRIIAELFPSFEVLLRVAALAVVSGYFLRIFGTEVAELGARMIKCSIVPFVIFACMTIIYHPLIWIYALVVFVPPIVFIGGGTYALYAWRHKGKFASSPIATIAATVSIIGAVALIGWGYAAYNYFNPF